jgi:tetratricopeptide (TPR) repeat protein
VPFDRDDALRKAEKLLRQGKIDLAITEYRAILTDQPSDWNTANTIGDLYFRAGQVDRAAAEYAKIADHFANEGFLPKAVALYKKILKIKASDEHAMSQLGTISAQQGLMVEARTNLLALAERRRTRGDRQGEAEVRIRLAELEGADLETRVAGARARVDLGDPRAAVEALKELAADLQEKGKDGPAVRLLTEAAQIDPGDTELRQLLVQAYVARGDFEAASQFATSAADLKWVAEELFRQGRDDEGINVLRSASDADPADSGMRADLAKLLIRRGDMDDARALLTSEVVGSDPELLWALAEMELRAGRIEEGTAVLQQILADDSSRRDTLVILGCSVAEVNPDAGYECIDVVAKAAIAAGEWGSAAAALNEFVSRVPNHIPALMRLVEICVDGGLEATMHSAQAQLADAYLIVGSGVEARVIAEDLVAREPWDRANIERFRRALTLLGETDVDAIIAERLSGESPFTSTDFLWPAEPAGTELAPMPVAMAPTPLPEPVSERRLDAELRRADEAEEPTAQAQERAPARVERREAHEVDLSGAIHDMRKDDEESGQPAASAAPAARIEDVLKRMRDAAGHDTSPETAEQHFSLAGNYMEMGMQDEAIQALEIAARSPRHRFRAAAMLAKVHLNAGDQTRAIEWYERAVEAPSPSPEAHHAMLYDLASLLEAHGESARALAVLLELQAEAGEYRDMSQRLEQLKVQMGG